MLAAMPHPLAEGFSKNPVQHAMKKMRAKTEKTTGTSIPRRREEACHMRAEKRTGRRKRAVIERQQIPVRRNKQDRDTLSVRTKHRCLSGEGSG
jgi:hypothetical protein